MDGIEDRWAKDNEVMKMRILPDPEGARQSIVGQVLQRWVEKNRAYRGQQMFLGLKAQFADINRKFWKLYSILWKDEPDTAGEGAIEICEDMIGHLLMTIYFLEEAGYTRTNELRLDGTSSAFNPDGSSRLINVAANQVPQCNACGTYHVPWLKCPIDPASRNG